ncbi:MAG: 2-hydroxyacid dehydrogenase [Gammaproteobacteria bacterium]
MHKAIFLDIASIRAEDLDLSCLSEQVSQLDCCDISRPEELRERLHDYDIVISNKVRLNRDTLRLNPQLKLICIAATGTNNVDLDAAKDLNIPVCNVRAYATHSVVQHVFSLILSLTTRLQELQTAIVQGKWSQSRNFSLLEYPVQELAAKNLGIIGYGELGQAVAKLAQAFGMQVLIAQRNCDDQRPGRIPLQQLLAQSDVISLHCPLSKDTEGLIQAAELQQMKSSAILINTARGGIVDESDLLSALKTGQIAGAGLDVLSHEPPAENHPLLVYKSPRLIITPHVAWAARESRQRLLDEIARNIDAFNQGKLRNSV